MLIPFIPSGNEDPVRITLNSGFPSGAVKVTVQAILYLPLAAWLKSIVITGLDRGGPNLGHVLVGKQGVIMNAPRRGEILLFQVWVVEDAIVMQPIEDLHAAQAVTPIHGQINSIQPLIP